MRKNSLQPAKSFRFRRWSRKNYAVFAGLNKVISIGQVSAGISDMAILKTNSFSVENNIFAKDSLKNKKEEDESEVLLFENLLQINIQTFATDIPVGGLNQILFINPKLEWRKISIPTFFI
ncbi:MAG: hypothetical protein GX361_03535 [Bacteroidales bacterium]|nr:hypothetical protein [Bacteroidales bacterium]